MAELMCDKCYCGPWILSDDNPQKEEDVEEGDRHTIVFSNAPPEECGTFRPQVELPKISDEELTRRAERIKPLYDFGPGKGLHYIREVDLHKVAFTWEPKSLLAPPSGFPFIRNLKPFTKIRTLHAYAYHGFFKPSVGEVLSQIPKEHLERCIAFQITDSPNTAADFNKDLFTFHSGFHVAETTLYGREQ